MGGQSKKMSLCEILTNYVIGFTIALCVQMLLMKIFELPTDIGRDLLITIIFTCVSVVRSYFVRRLFNWMQFRAHKITEEETL